MNISEESAAQEKNCSAVCALKAASPQESMMRISVLAGLSLCQDREKGSHIFQNTICSGVCTQDCSLWRYKIFDKKHDFVFCVCVYVCVGGFFSLKPLVLLISVLTSYAKLA